MIADTLTVIWKEWRELLFQRGSLRATVFSWLPLMLIFGVFIPSQAGSFWVESPLTIAFWGWLPTLPVIALITDAFAGERERHTLETLLASPLSEAAILFGKLIAVVSYGWLMALLILLAGLVTVNAIYGDGELLLYPTAIVVSGMILGILTATAAASIGVIFSLRSPTVRQAAQQLAFVSIALTWLPILGFSALPNNLQASLLKSATSVNLTQVRFLGLALLVVINAVLLLVAMARFKRSRLILD